MLSLWKNLPRDIVHIILKFDGKIIYFNGKYFDINKIKELDYRYNLLRPVVLKKTDIISNIECYNKKDFYFEFKFDEMPEAGLVYDFGFLKENTLEICYFDFRDDRNDGLGIWLQIRTTI
jgi:hypothetical protein